MSDLEHRLLALLTEAKNMARAQEMGLLREVFDEPICSHVYDWMLGYWRESDKAPTRLAMKEKWPSEESKLPTDVGESVSFLVDTLKQRWATNQPQTLMLDSAETSFEDPVATLAQLAHDATEASQTVKTGSLLDRLGINGADLDAMHFEPLQYAVPGIVTEGIGLMGGPPKLGKSWVAIDIGLAVASGGLAFGSIPCVQRPVLYLALEDGGRRLQERSRAALAGGPIPAGITFITTATPAEALEVIAEFS